MFRVARSYMYNGVPWSPASDARSCPAMKREPDLAARYGGEEFAIILPSTSKEGAIKLAERLRRSAEARVPDRKSVNQHAIPGYTISLGVATFPDDAITLNELLNLVVIVSNWLKYKHAIHLCTV